MQKKECAGEKTGIERVPMHGSNKGMIAKTKKHEMQDLTDCQAKKTRNGRSQGHGNKKWMMDDCASEEKEANQCMKQSCK